MLLVDFKNYGNPFYSLTNKFLVETPLNSNLYGRLKGKYTFWKLYLQNRVWMLLCQVPFIANHVIKKVAFQASPKEIGQHMYIT